METYNIGTDASVELGDLESALRFKWASVSVFQIGLNTNAIRAYAAPNVFKASKPQRSYVKLKRTFNQKMLDGTSVKYWRVITPGHKNEGSDLSLEGLKQWSIL